MSKVLLRSFFSFAIVLLAANPAGAASFLVPPDAALVERSDAVVWGTVLASMPERSGEGTIQTVSVISVDEVLKGVISSATIRVVELGGALDGQAAFYSGMPQYEPGARVLVLLARDRNGNWTTKDLVLGKFELATTPLGERVLIREEGKIAGWDLAGNVYGGANLRRADAFLQFVRKTASGEKAEADYFLADTRDAQVGKVRVDGSRDVVTSDSSFTASQYVLHYNIGTSKPVRWKHDADSLNGLAPVAPWPDMKDGVIWKISAGNLQANLSGGGVTQTQQALASWTDDCGSLVRYLYGGTTATEVRLDGACPGNGCDGVSGIAFGDPFNEIPGIFGVDSFTLGRGGSLAYNIEHALSPESFWTFYEGHIVINNGVEAWSGLATSEFVQLMVHELGHTLGFRHSDRNTAGDDACPTLTHPCSDTSIMAAFLSIEYGGTLQGWDRDAVRTVYPGGACAVRGDFNGDTKPDLLWRNYNSGAVNAWFLNGTSYAGGMSLFTVADPMWRLEGSGDFNGDGKADLIWRNYATGAVNVWFLNGTAYLGGVNLFTVADQNWEIETVGDFNGDGKDDLIWRNYASGAVNAWFLNGTTYLGGAALFTVVDPNWKIEVAGDYNGDGKTDLIWRNYATGAVNVWFLNGSAYMGGANLFTVADPLWNLEATGDYNGDGKLDLVWRHYGNGSVNAWFLNGTTYMGGAPLFTVAGDEWEIAGPR